MPARSTLFAASLVLTAIVSGAATAQTEPTEPYPVWLSPSFGLDGLDDVERRLEDPAWFGRSIPLYKGERGNRQEAIADSCGSLDRIRQEGYDARSTHSIRVLRYHLAKCRALEMLSEAKPSRISYVKGVTLNPGIVDYLPALVEPSGSCDNLCRQVDANERCVPWSKFGVSRLDPSIFESIDVVDPHQMDVKTNTSLLTLQILARADFNDDGLEDLLLRVNAGAIGGTWGTTKVYVLTRDRADGVLRVVDAERYLCSADNYTCDETYGYTRNPCKAN